MDLLASSRTNLDPACPLLGVKPRPIGDRNPHFHVLRVSPGNGDGLWTYVSIGNWAWESGRGRGLEFVLATATPTERAVELLAWNSWYDRAGILGLGHTVPIEEPWLPGSVCDHWLISLPYPWGPDLEVAHIEGTQVDFLWLVPIARGVVRRERRGSSREPSRPRALRATTGTRRHRSPTRRRPTPAQRPRLGQGHRSRPATHGPHRRGALSRRGTRPRTQRARLAHVTHLSGVATRKDRVFAHRVMDRHLAVTCAHVMADHRENLPAA